MKSTLFCDPYSGHEVLLLEDKIPAGAAFDPRRKEVPRAWHGSCPHCMTGRSELGTHLRRQVEMLGSRKTVGRSGSSPIYEYELPLGGKIRYWVASDGQKKATVIDSKSILAASQSPGEKIELSSPIASPTSMRCLRFLMSARPATPEEILACVRPLATEQLRRASLPGRRPQCEKLLDWSEIVRAAEAYWRETRST